MKNRLHDKKAGIAILVSLIIISVAEVIYRAVVANGIAFSTANFGEQLTVIIFALMILIFSATGKDRVCYILYGAWIAYFVMDQAFELPGMIGDLFINNSHPSITFSIILRMASMLCIILSANVAGVNPDRKNAQTIMKITSRIFDISFSKQVTKKRPSAPPTRPPPERSSAASLHIPATSRPP